MLWINGYCGKPARMFKITPKPGRAYWGGNLSAAGYVLKDWNWIFVDPEIKAITSPSARFKEGYVFAQENENIIRNNIMVCGNMFQIVAHGQGVAFAEGVSAFFFEEKGIVTDLSVYIQGTNMGAIPQSRRAVECRVVCTTDNDLPIYKRKSTLRFKDVCITENNLGNGFCRYSIALPSSDSGKISNLYFRFSLKDKSAHFMHINRSFPLWSSIEHGLNMYIENEVDSYSDNVADVRNVMLEKYIMN